MIHLENYRAIQEKAKENNVDVIAVSKFKTIESIKALYDLGHRDFGENYVQELVSKQEQLPADIRWHYIGHLQRNKVKYIAPFVHLIHGVDSFRLLKEINKRAEQHEREISCLLQIKVSEEDTKTGMDDKELLEFISFYEAQKEELQNVKIKGIMGMSRLTDNTDSIREDFKNLKTIFDFAQKSYFILDDDFKVLSMGMSGDYEIAIEEGSNMIRIGSLIFGQREAI